MYAFLFSFLFAIYSAQDIECTVCQFVVTYAEKFVQRNESEQFIINELDKLCAKLPIFGPQCDQIVQNYAPRIIAWLVKKEPADQFCVSVRLCTHSSQNNDNHVVTQQTNGKSRQGHVHSHHSMVKIQEKREKEDVHQTIPCSLCRLITAYVEKYIEQNATEQVIIQRLEAFCADIGPLQPECRTFVSAYAPRLIHWILSKENPNVFCAQVRICSSQSKLPEKVVNLKQKRETEQTLCQTCQLVLTYVEEWVVQNNTIEDIEQKAEELCNIAPSPIAGFCDSIVEQYLPAMVNWLIRKEDPDVFCTQVKLC